MNIALTIAGSDSGGGAGIQADLKTFQELHVYGTSAITAITAQNTQGVQKIFPLPENVVIEQIRSIRSDLEPHAIKTGMLWGKCMVEAIAKELADSKVPLIADPVMLAKDGSGLLQEDAIQAYREWILPLVTICTPNIPEAERLTEMSIHNLDDQKTAALRLVKLGPKSVVVKGGHLSGEQCVDVLYDQGKWYTFHTPRIHTLHTHGTGCTFAACITASLARGNTVPHAVKIAKSYVQKAIEHGIKVGNGLGPINHWAYQEECENES